MKSASDAVVKVDNVYKEYYVGAKGVPVLRGINFEIQPGEFVAIVGSSGNGKSTLLNMITGIDHPTSGKVVVDGCNLNSMSEDQLAEWRGRHLGIVFQFFQLLPALNLIQNTVLPMDFAKRLNRKTRRERAYHLLDLVGIVDQAHKLPSQVSGGQQQRAAIARALANDPTIIVADEPTGNLDAQTSADVLEVFCHLIDQGKTVIIVTHERELSARASRCLHIEDGVLGGAKSPA